MRLIYSTSPEEVEAEHPFDEEKIIEVIEHESTRKHSESRDDAGMQHEEVEKEEKHSFDEEKIIEVKEYEPMRNHSESRDDMGMQHGEIIDKEGHPFNEEKIIEVIEYANRCETNQNTERGGGKKEFNRKKKTKKPQKKNIPKEDKGKERITQKVDDELLKIPSKPKMKLEDLASVSVRLMEEEEAENEELTHMEENLLQIHPMKQHAPKGYEKVVFESSKELNHISLSINMDKSNQKFIQYEQELNQKVSTGSFNLIQFDDIDTSRENLQQQQQQKHLQLKTGNRNVKERSRSIQETIITMDPPFITKDNKQQDIIIQKFCSPSSKLKKNSAHESHNSRSLNIMETETEQSIFPDIEKVRKNTLKSKKVEERIISSTNKVEERIILDTIEAGEGVVRDLKQANDEEILNLNGIDKMRHDEGNGSVRLIPYIPSTSFETTTDEMELRKTQSNLEQGLKTLLNEVGVSFPPNASAEEIKIIFQKEDEKIRKYLDNEDTSTEKKSSKKRENSKKEKNPNEAKKSEKIEESRETLETQEDIGSRNHLFDGSFEKADQELDDSRLMSDLEVGLKKLLDKVGVSYPSNASGNEIKEIFEKEEEAIEKYLDESKKIAKDGKVKTHQKKKSRNTDKSKRVAKDEKVKKRHKNKYNKSKSILKSKKEIEKTNATEKTETAGLSEKKKNRPHKDSQSDTNASGSLQKEGSSGSLKVNDKYLSEDDISMLTEDMQTFREARAELAEVDFLEPEFITEGRPQEKRQEKQMEGSISGEAITGDLFLREGVYSSMIPQNNARQRQPTPTIPTTFNPGAEKSLVPRTTVLQRSSHDNTEIPLVPMMNAISQIMANSGKKFLKSDVVDETIVLVDDIQRALGNDAFSCNYNNSSKGSDSYTSYELSQSDLHNVEKVLAGYFQQGLTSIHETVAQNFHDDISNSGSTYSRSSRSRSSYSRVSYARSRSQASYARSRAASHYARKSGDANVRSHGESNYAINSQQGNTHSHGLSSYIDAESEALLQEKEALENAIADLRAQKNLMEMQSKLQSEKELMEMNARLKAEKEALERSMAESASAYSHNNSKYTESNCDASIHSHTPSSNM